jgi:hypothetical protein
MPKISLAVYPAGLELWMAAHGHQIIGQHRSEFGRRQDEDG